jgi:hypothetical protein
MLPRRQQPSYGRIRELFEAGERLSAHDVEARVFIDVRNAREYLKLLRQDGVIRIVAWRRDSPHGLPTPVFGLADGKRDTPRPKPMTGVEKSRKRRKDPDVRDGEARKKRCARDIERLSKNPPKDPILAALTS